MTFPQTKRDVEIELNLGDTVTINGQTYPVWQDITSDVRQTDGIDITRGKSDEAGQSAPQQCRLTVNNRSGKYSPRNPLGEYYGRIGRNTEARVGIKRDAVHDASTTSSAGTGDLSFTHTPSGTPTGVCVIILQAGSSSDQVTSVTYGGVAMTRHFQVSTTFGAISGRKYVYFLGRDVPTGAQTVAVTVSGAATKQACAMTVTGGTESEIDSVGSNSGTGTNPATGITLRRRALLFAGLMTDLDDPSLVSPGGGMTQISETDLGTEVTAFARAIAQSPSVLSVGWTAGTSGWSVVAVAIRATSYRFWGEVSSFPPRWDTSGNDAWVPIEASGILRRLGQGVEPAESGMKTFVLNSDRTFRYWPLEGSVGTQYSLDIAPVWITNTDRRFESFGASFKYGESMGSPYLGTGMALFNTTNGWMVGDVRNGYSYWAFDMVFQSLELGEMNVFFNDYNGKFWTLNLDGGAGVAQVSYNDPLIGIPTTVFSATGVLPELQDQLPHHIRFKVLKNGTATDWFLYIDGVEVDTGTQASYEVYGMVNFQMEYARTGTQSWVNLAHIVVWSDSVSELWPSAAAVSQAAQGYLGETAGVRIERICDFADVDVVVVGDSSDTTAMGPQYSEGLLTQLRDAEQADLGVLTEPRDAGGLLYRTRASHYNQTATVTLDYSAGQVAPTFEPVDDDQLIRNDITVTRRDGDSYRTTRDTGALSTLAPPNGVGRYRDEVTMNVETDAMLSGVAGWLLNRGTLDEARYPSIAVDLANPDTVAAGLEAAVLGVDIGDVVAITNADNANIPDDIAAIVFGYAERINTFEHRLVFNCGPASIYDTAVYGTSASVGTDRWDTGGSSLASSATSTATSLSVATDTGEALWTTDAAAFPFDVQIAGERITVTNITGSSSPQTFTVTRSVNGIVKAQASGADVSLFNTPRYAL